MLIFIRDSIRYSLRLFTRRAISGMPPKMMIMCPLTYRSFIKMAFIETQAYRKISDPQKTERKEL